MNQAQNSMLEKIRQYGVSDERVITVMGEVDRADFVLPEQKQFAYEDRPLNIGYGQTISQPFTVARMIELLLPALPSMPPFSQMVLEIGAGSGYQTAILSRLFERVLAIEVIPELAQKARLKMNDSGFENVKVKAGDGKEGWEEYSPYDAIISAADAAEVPDAWVEQLNTGGRIVSPVRGEMVRLTKMTEGSFIKENFGKFSFVPLV